MNKKCLQCGLVNFPTATACERCGSDVLSDSARTDVSQNLGGGLIRRALICLAVCLAVIPVFYLSLLASARSLSYDQKNDVKEAITLLRDKGFADEAARRQGKQAANWAFSHVLRPLE